MAESFSNKLTRAAGLVVLKTGSSVAANTNAITVTSNTGIYVGQLVDNQHFIAGTKVSNVSGTTINTSTQSTNSAVAASQVVNFLGVTTAFTASATEKSILIGGTFANNTNNQVSLTVELYDNSTTVGVAIASKIPVPAGSSFVISDVGKTILEPNDEIRIYCNTEDAIDASLSILTGVS
jgi:hypothetical protein